MSSVIYVLCVQAEVHIPEVVVHFGVLGGGSLNALLSVTTVLEAKATTWSSDVSLSSLKCTSFLSTILSLWSGYGGCSG